MAEKHEIEKSSQRLDVIERNFKLLLSPFKATFLPERYLVYLFQDNPKLKFTTIRECKFASTVLAVGILNNGYKILFPLTFLNRGEQTEIAQNNYVLLPGHEPIQFTDPRGTTDQEKKTAKRDEGFTAAHVQAFQNLVDADTNNPEFVRLYSIEIYLLRHWIDFGKEVQDYLRPDTIQMSLDPLDEEYFQKREPVRMALTAEERTYRRDIVTKILDGVVDHIQDIDDIEAVIEAFCTNIFDKVLIKKNKDTDDEGNDTYQIELHYGPDISVSCNLEDLLIFLESHPGTPMRFGYYERNGNKIPLLMIAGIKTKRFEPVRYPFQFTVIHLDKEILTDELIQLGLGHDLEHFATEIHHSISTNFRVTPDEIQA